MSRPWWRRHPGPNRGNHQSSLHVATPATGKRPKPTTACWVGSRPYCWSGASAATSFLVLLAGVRRTESTIAWSSGGKPPAPAGAAVPSPDAGGGGSVVVVVLGAGGGVDGGR